MIKPFTGAHGDHDPDRFRYRRHHTGAPPAKTDPPLRPLWPRMLGGVGLIAVSAPWIMSAGHALGAVAGVIPGLIGIYLVLSVARELSRDVD